MIPVAAEELNSSADAAAYRDFFTVFDVAHIKPEKSVEELRLLAELRELQSRYEAEAKPLIDRLVELNALRAPKIMLDTVVLS